MCVQNPLLWPLKREEWPSVEKTKANCLYKCIDDFWRQHNLSAGLLLVFYEVKLVLTIVHCRLTIGFVI